MTSGFSGLPKFKQFVAATGRAPLVATFRAVSATACIAPTLGFSWHHRPFPSVDNANARIVFPLGPSFSDSLIRTTAASLAPGPASVFVRTMVSYCSVIHRFEAIAGDANNFLKLRDRSFPSGADWNQSFSLSTRGAGAAIGRRYTGPSSANGCAGISAATTP